jgi:hypothetical protein
MSRKKGRLRAMRMAGLGLDPATGLPRRTAKAEPAGRRPLLNPWIDPAEARRAAEGRAASPAERCGAPPHGRLGGETGGGTRRGSQASGAGGRRQRRRWRFCGGPFS